MLLNHSRVVRNPARLAGLCRVAALALLAAVGTLTGLAELPDSPNARMNSSRPGPWGRVEWHYIHIEAPEWIVEQFAGAAQKPKWCFPGATVPALRTFLIQAGVAPQTADAWLADPQAILGGENAITLFPSVAELLAMGGAARSTIYGELAKSPLNTHHHGPVIILDRNFDDWLGSRSLRPELRQAFERMTYLRGDALAFSDLPALRSLARDAAEERDVLKLWTRARSVMACLHVDERDDIEALEKYWTAGRRQKDIGPILESISQLSRGGRIGFAHLLTAQARKLLYTYPTPDLEAYGPLPDCHWTTLNFFNYRVQNVLLDQRLAARQVIEGYAKVEPPYTFGDALFFITSDGRAIHSCTYLCDDLVFTKNGAAPIAPWTIARIEDVSRFYAQLEPALMHGFRRIWNPRR